MADYTYGQGSNWYDRDFPYWDENLLPTPREVMQALESNRSGNLGDVVRNLRISGTEQQCDAEMILTTFLYETGNEELMQKYGL